MKINESILVLMLIIFIYFLYRIKNNRLTLETADNNIKYMVYNDMNKKKSANLLAELTDRMYKLKNYLVENKSQFKDHIKYIELLEQNFTTERTSIYENRTDSSLTSYSINKGEELAFCLKSKKTNEYHDINLLMYVALHEMAHMACPEIGHGELFKNIFHFLTTISIKIDLYKKTNYNDNPVEFCGMTLSSSIV
jgi:predicted metal-dependent hydrolase